MARLNYTNCSIIVNGVDLSSDCKEVTVQTGAEMQDDGAMGDTTKKNAAGLLTWSITANFFQDFSSGKADATLAALNGAAAFNIVVKPVAGAASATNPAWSGNAVLQDYTPLQGTHGSRGMAPVTFASAGTLTRVAS